MGTVSYAARPSGEYLTNRVRIKEELGIGVTTYDDLIDRLIAEASWRVYRIVGRPLFRAQWTETLRGNSRTILSLSRYPLVSLESVSYDGAAQTLSDFEIADDQAGLVYHSTGFGDTGDPNLWSFTYTAGYFLVGSNQTLTTVSAAASDDSYNDSASGFDTLLRPGDYMAVSGFSNAANNGTRLIESATAAKLVTDGTLTDEAAGTTVAITLERVETEFVEAAHILVKDRYQSLSRTSDLSSLKVGPLEYRFSQKASSAAHDLLAPHVPI